MPHLQSFQPARPSNLICTPGEPAGAEAQPLLADSRLEKLGRFLEIPRVEPFGKPAIALGQPGLEFRSPPLLPVQTDQTHQGPQFQSLLSTQRHLLFKARPSCRWLTIATATVMEGRLDMPGRSIRRLMPARLQCRHPSMGRLLQ